MIKILIRISIFTAIIPFLFFLGCSEGNEAPQASVADNSYLSPVISDLSISGEKISRTDGGILKIYCQWTAAYSIGSASAYVQFVEDVNNPVTGPTGVISSTTFNASGTLSATQTLKISLSKAMATPVFSEILPATTASSTTAATSTVTVATSPWYYGIISNPMVIPTGIATTKSTGYWSVEIPFPASIVGKATLGTQQMLVWMVLNDRKTNTLAFEIQFTE